MMLLWKKEGLRDVWARARATSTPNRNCRSQVYAIGLRVMR